MSLLRSTWNRTQQRSAMQQGLGKVSWTRLARTRSNAELPRIKTDPVDVLGATNKKNAIGQAGKRCRKRIGIRNTKDVSLTGKGGWETRGAWGAAGT